MRNRDIDIFFLRLSEEWKYPTRIILIGGAAALLFGGVRPTLDVDFQFCFGKELSFDDFSEAVSKVVKKTGIEAQFSDVVDRWSSLSFLDFDQHLIHYKTFGRIEVYLTHPLYWSLGKIGRYLTSDCHDMIEVFKRHPVDPKELARLWRKALTASPRSEQIPMIKKYMIDFFKHYGKKIWTNQFNLAEVLEIL